MSKSLKPIRGNPMASVHCLAKFIKFIRRTEWDEAFAAVVEQHLGRACGNLGVEADEIFDILGDVAGTILHGCALEDFMTREYAGGRNVVDEYLRRRGYAESAGTRRYIQALRHSVMSLYEVSDIVPGQSFLARDLIRGGEPARVMEVSGTKTLKPWDRIGVRLLRLGSEWRMAGGVLRYQRRAADFLMDTLKRIDRKLPPDLRELAKREVGSEGLAAIERDLEETLPLAMMAPTFTGIWLADALERALNPQLPELVNTDGHKIVMCTTTFPLLPGAGTATCKAGLAAVPHMRKAGRKAFDWIEAKGAKSGPAPPSRASGITLMTTSGSGETVLGSIAIERSKVVLSTNSRERAEIGEAMLGKALAGLVGGPVRQEATVEEMLAGRERRAAKRRSAEVPPEAARPLVHAYLDRHYRRTLDEPLPVLGNFSPRDAARCERGRFKVVEWLKDMENHAARAGDGTDPMASYDFGWIWRELGIGHMRM